jgi:predicted O-methyltransferase YrrM
MDTVLPEEIARFVRAMVSEDDPVYRELAAYNEERGFPTVGPEVGAALRVLARTAGAERVFEFGSGLGYSAYWIAPVLPADGDLVLTDFDESNLETAREFLERGGYADRAAFEVGDALESFERYDGPFDLVLVDNLEEQYVETFERAREKLAPGGVICADNVMTGGAVDFDDALAALEGEGEGSEGDEADSEMSDSTAAVVDFLRHVRGAEGFETALLPLGEGLTVSVATE